MSKSKFKVGDKVILVKPEGSLEYPPYWVPAMDKFVGKTVVIRGDIVGDSVSVEGNGWLWHRKWLTPVAEKPEAPADIRYGFINRKTRKVTFVANKGMTRDLFRKHIFRYENEVAAKISVNRKLNPDTAHKITHRNRRGLTALPGKV